MRLHTCGDFIESFTVNFSQVAFFLLPLSSLLSLRGEKDTKLKIPGMDGNRFSEKGFRKTTAILDNPTFLS